MQTTSKIVLFSVGIVAGSFAIYETAKAILSKENDQTWRCDACKYINQISRKTCRECNAELIIVPITTGCNGVRFGQLPFEESFNVSITYASNVKIRDLFNKIITIVNKKYYPEIHHIQELSRKSFIRHGELTGNSFYNSEPWDNICSKSLTEYKKQNIIDRGLEIIWGIQYKHKIINNDIKCQYIVAHQNINNKLNPIDLALKCPIYASTKHDYKFTENNLNHLCEFSHFTDEYRDKPSCRYNCDCKAFLRLENGGNRLDDKCHVKIYKHPPRNNRQIKLSENTHSFIFNSESKQNHPIYSPTEEDWEKYRDNDEIDEKDGFVHALMEEVIRNGYKSDLCLECNAECKHNEYSLLTVVEEKLNHIRHRQVKCPLDRAEMLALVLYTGCDCNYDVCSSQRNGDFMKWKWFDMCLYDAIEKLSHTELGSYKLYSGLSKVKLSKMKIDCGYFITYTSTSWSKDVSVSFMQDEGMLIEMDKGIRSHYNVISCDVSWISKFGDECEVLIARSVSSNCNFTFSVLDEHNGVQTVLVSKKENSS